MRKTCKNRGQRLDQNRTWQLWPSRLRIALRLGLLSRLRFWFWRGTWTYSWSAITVGRTCSRVSDLDDPRAEHLLGSKRRRGELAGRPARCERVLTATVHFIKTVNGGVPERRL